MDNLGAIGGPLLALGLVALVDVRAAMLLSIIPGLLATATILYAIRHTPRPARGDRQPIRLRIRPVLRGELGRLLGAVAAFEVGNVAATLLILRATELRTPLDGATRAAELALILYTGHNLAAIFVSFPAGRSLDRLGRRGPIRILAVGVALFAAA
jgi:MFS family permease